MDLDLSKDVMVETLTVKYGPGFEPDTVGPFDLVGTADRIQELYQSPELKGKPDHVTAVPLHAHLVGLGFKNLPPIDKAAFAAHALAQWIVKLADTRKKKFEATLWAAGDAPPEWPASTPDSPAS